MRKIDLSQSLQLLGNLGVIVGILLLAYELNQNRELTMAQTRHDLSQGTVQLLLELAADPNHDVLVRGDREDDLSYSDQRRYERLVMAQLRLQEDIYYQYRNGLYDEGEYIAQRESWKTSVFARPGHATVFCDRRSGLSPEFVAEIEAILVTNECQ